MNTTVLNIVEEVDRQMNRTISSRSRPDILCLMLAAFLILSFWPTPLEAKKPTTTIAVIVHKKSSVANLSLAELKDVFQKRRRAWSDGKTIIPINNASLRTSFDKLLLGMTKAQMGAFWVKQAIAGRTRPPRTVNSATLALRLVAALQGAISFVKLSEVNDTVKVIHIDKVSPRDSKYKYKF